MGVQDPGTKLRVELFQGMGLMEDRVKPKRHNKGGSG